jgi:hypothetical protein
MKFLIFWDWVDTQGLVCMPLFLVNHTRGVVGQHCSGVGVNCGGNQSQGVINNLLLIQKVF